MKVLLVGEGLVTPGQLLAILRRSGLGAEVQFCASWTSVLDLAGAGAVDVVITQPKLPGKDGEALLKTVKAIGPGIYTILLGKRKKSPRPYIDEYITTPAKFPLALRRAFALGPAREGPGGLGGNPGPNFGSPDRSRRTLRAISRVASGFCPLLLVVLAGILILGSAGGRYFQGGYRFYRVVSGSMSPAIATGSLVLVQAAPAEIEVGDIITFRGAVTGQFTTHRVAGIEEGPSYITRGDANQVNDPSPVFPDQVQGKVIRVIPLLGYLAGLLQTRLGLLFLLFIPGVLLLVHEVRRIIWGQSPRPLRPRCKPA